MSVPPASRESRTAAPAPIDCETAVRRLWDYLDGRLPSAAHDEVEAHLATCQRCPPHFIFARSMQSALAASAPALDEAGAAEEARLRERVRRALMADRADRSRE